MSDILDLDLRIAEKLIAKGDVLPSELAQAAIARIDGDADARACFIRFEPEQALAQARELDSRVREQPLLPLGGIPMAHKDLFALPGRTITAAAHKAFHYSEEVTADALAALDRAGAVNLGGLHLSEFAMGPAGWTPHFGFLRNPHSPDLVTGGSSSGSATAVARRVIFAALGTDTGGSIRIPSAFCEVVGLKPSVGLVSTKGCFPVSKTLDVIGPIARTVSDCARMLDALTGGQATRSYESVLAALPPLRFGVLLLQSLPVPPDPEVAAAYANATQSLRAAGLDVRKVEVEGLAELNALSGVVFLTEAAAVHGDRLENAFELIGPQVSERLLRGLAETDNAYLLARRAREQHLAELRQRLFSEVDVLMLPTSPSLPPLRAAYDAFPDTNAVLAFNGRLGAYTPAFSYLGVPALSLPFRHTGTQTRGFGLQMVADHGRDATLLQAARLAEIARDRN